MTTPNSDRQVDVSMPYLSGPALCGILTKFGLNTEYGWGGGSLSRWNYMQNLLNHCIDNDRFDVLLKYLFNKQQFSTMLAGLDVEDIEFAYSEICRKVINSINSELHFGGNELVYRGNYFNVLSIGTQVFVEAPKIKTIDRTYITDLSGRALKDIQEQHYDSAITKARTLLEEVFCFVIEQRGDVVSSKGDINKLYKQVKELFNMHQNKDTDVRINALLSGLEKILSSIAEMRNANSGAHGVGAKRFSINDYHARLFVNSATTMADFILSVSENQEN